MQLIFTNVSSNNELQKKLEAYDSPSAIADVELGHGADFPGILVELFNNVDWKLITGGTAVGLFFLGDKINKNIDAWLEVFKKQQI